ncbi:hypothetical protein JCM11251_003721 [Rhodosporidiobolus azoricus]
MTSPASVIRTVAIAGTGNLGSVLIPELASPSWGFSSVRVLTRSASSSTPSLPSNVERQLVDYANQQQVVEALQGVDAVVSALTNPDSQAALVKAAKEAGVKLFVPGEFGNPSTAFTQADHPAVYGKKETQELLKEVGLPALLVFCGPFTDLTFNPYFDLNFPSGRATIIGTGRTPVSFTSRSSVARFLAHHLSTAYSSSSSLPSANTPEILRIQGDRKTFLEVVEAYERLHPEKGKIQVEHISIEEAEKSWIEQLKKGEFFPSVLTYLLASWERGNGQVDKGEGEGVLAKWAGWRPETVEDILKAL